MWGDIASSTCSRRPTADAPSPNLSPPAPPLSPAALRHPSPRAPKVCEVAVTDAPRGAFAQKHAEQDLRRLVGSEQPVHARAFETQQQLPVGCFSALCRHLDLPSLTESHGQWGIEWVNATSSAHLARPSGDTRLDTHALPSLLPQVEPREFVRLDASALRALSVEPQPNEADRNASLYGIFAKTKTAGGGRLLRKWLKQPLLSPHEIEHRLDLVQTFVSSLELRATLRDTCLPAMGARAGSSRLRRPAACARRRCGLCPLVGADLDRLQRRLFSGRATLQDVVLLYSLLGSLPRLLSALAGGGYAEGGEGEGEVDGHTLVQSAFTEPLQVVHENFERYRQLVHAAVDLEAAARRERRSPTGARPRTPPTELHPCRRHEYLIRPHFDEERRPGLGQPRGGERTACPFTDAAVSRSSRGWAPRGTRRSPRSRRRTRRCASGWAWTRGASSSRRGRRTATTAASRARRT